MRHNSIEILDLDTMNISVLKSIKFVDRIFHTCTLWPSSEPNKISIILSYGRSNPSKMFNSITLLNLPLQAGGNEIDEANAGQVTVLNTDNDLGFRSRFRHASCMTSDSRLFVYGGKYFDEESQTSHSLNDAYFIDEKFQIDNVKIDEMVCIARHSHCINSWKHYLIISGGLDQNENPLSDIILFDCQKLTMKKLHSTSGQVFSRYSHTAHIIEDTLILVGGCNFSNVSPGICFFDLNTLAAFEFNIPSNTDDSEPLMLIQHQSHMLDRNRLLVVGGGAICFTFGTHLNRKPFVLDLTNCWTKFYPA